MRYTNEVVIQLPREKVIELFDSTENMYKWQEGLKNFEHLEGEAGQEGARSKLIYDSRRGQLEIIETISKRNFPEEFIAIYTSKGVHNESINRFIARDQDTTVWQAENTFRFRGMMALMAPFMKSAFVSNTQLNLERFKAFAEGE